MSEQVYRGRRTGRGSTQTESPLCSGALGSSRCCRNGTMLSLQEPGPLPSDSKTSRCATLVVFHVLPR
eukprot:295258-Hanusia_phi.AAC.1